MADEKPKSISETEAKVREELAAERAARIQTERILATRSAAPPPAAPPVREPDFLGKFKEEAQLPDGQAEALRRGVVQNARGVVAEMVGPELAKIRQEIGAAHAAGQYESGLEALKSRNPNLDNEKIAAAVGAADLEANAKGLRLSPTERLRMVEAKAKALFPAAEPKKVTADTPPFVEGKSNADTSLQPGGAGKMAEETASEAHPLAEFYFGEGSDIPVVNHDKNLPANLKAMVDDHTARKNDYLMERGVKSFMPKVAGPASKRFKEKKKAAAAAAGRG